MGRRCRPGRQRPRARAQVDGLPRTAARSKYDLDGGAGAVSLLIRVSHKARRRGPPALPILYIYHEMRPSRRQPARHPRVSRAAPTRCTCAARGARETRAAPRAGPQPAVPEEPPVAGAARGDGGGQVRVAGAPAARERGGARRGAPAAAQHHRGAACARPGPPVRHAQPRQQRARPALFMAACAWGSAPDFRGRADWGSLRSCALSCLPRPRRAAHGRPARLARRVGPQAQARFWQPPA